MYGRDHNIVKQLSSNIKIKLIMKLGQKTRMKLHCPWDFSGKNRRVSCHFLRQGIFLTQGSNPCLECLLHHRQILCLLSHQGSQLVHKAFIQRNLELVRRHFQFVADVFKSIYLVSVKQLMVTSFSVFLQEWSVKYFYH